MANCCRPGDAGQGTQTVPSVSPAQPTGHTHDANPPTLTEVSTTPAPALGRSEGTREDFGPRPCVNGAASDSRACKLRSCVHLCLPRSKEKATNSHAVAVGRDGGETHPSMSQPRALKISLLARCAVKGLQIHLTGTRKPVRDQRGEGAVTSFLVLRRRKHGGGPTSRRTRVD